jgi:nucleotide-binding universal stress UspA family protein
LCSRPRSGPTEPGPRSVGHVARFVMDHSPVPVLLIRRTG